MCPACDTLCTIPMPGAETELVAAELVDASDLDGETDVEELRTVSIPCPKCRHESLCDETLFDTKGLCKNCGHIFLITDDPVKRVLADRSAPTRYVFKCPSCSQLYEGKKPMHGANGKCSACGDVFEIRLKKAKKPKPKLPPRKRKRTSSAQSDDSQRPSFEPGSYEQEQGEELELIYEVEVVEEAVEIVSEIPIEQPSYSQMVCGACMNVMSVGSALPVGTVVACPHCQNEVVVPDLENGMQR